MTDFKAYRLTKEQDQFFAKVDRLSFDDLPSADVLIKVHYSSVNFKDGLANSPDGKIVQTYPFVPGIDLAGEVVESKDKRFKPGDQVIATSYEIGVSHFGGYSEYASIPGDWIVPLPDGLSLREAMIYGTAGLTAALSIERLEQIGISKDKGEVLVTGATGGVGSMAIAMLHKRGYHVVASSGKNDAKDYLVELGAKQVISRSDVYDEKIKPLDKQLWQAAVDPVGGNTLAATLSKIKYQGAVAVSGLTGGTSVPTTVFPFILRGVSLIGIDSVYCPMEVRKILWQRMATDLKPNNLVKVAREITIEQLPGALSAIINGKVIGRTIVNLTR
ncbi:NADPH:quinone oxidoreductase family protein [Aquibacillus salsiterrae]|uniref:Acryloyl-CoA reductase n=1 Tax=Aquibacillus salsiterrae TaxID=2950439 RepID=A0A9X3WEQ2_9BACI|nr:acryloyl-CoA reductase [Aquibacillus salsiterrae]MDC3416880.1 acryloyl-CoA reductase [Aquibacillus salsiterrae]